MFKNVSEIKGDLYVLYVNCFISIYSEEAMNF